MITNLSTNQAVTLNNPLNYFSFSQVAGYDPMASNSVQVAAMTTGVYSLYGPTCTLNGAEIATKAITKADVLAFDFSATAYPNPFVSDFKIALNIDNDDTVQVAIYDMTGRLLDTAEMKSSDISTARFASRYPSGVYNCIVSFGNLTQTLRVIKR